MPSSTPALPALTWSTCAFADLTVFQLERILRARGTVFHVEQGSLMDAPYLDVDGRDLVSTHICCWGEGVDLPLAYCRVVQPGVKFTEPAIGRVLTSASARGTGLGKQLLGRAAAFCDAEYPGQGIRISAQSYLIKFYGGVGFTVVGEEYEEEGIPHVEMLRP